MAIRRQNKHFQERVLLSFDHGQLVDASLSTKLFTVPPGRKFRLDRAWYNNPTGLVAHAANFFDIQLLKDATVMANHSTEVGQEGTITADTPVYLVASATDDDLVADAGDELILTLDENGTSTLELGRLVIEGRLL